MRFTSKRRFDATLAAIVAAWFFGGRALFSGPDFDVFLVRAAAILTFLFLSAAISLGPLARLWRPATRFIYNRRHLGVTTWALAECPWHGYQFDPCTGLGPPGFTDSVPRYELVTKGNQTYLRAPQRRRL